MPRRSHHLLPGSKKGKGYDRWEQADMKDEGGIFLAGYSRRGSNPLDIFPLRGAKASRRTFFRCARQISAAQAESHGAYTVRQKSVLVVLRL